MTCLERKWVQNMNILLIVFSSGKRQDSIHLLRITLQYIQVAPQRARACLVSRAPVVLDSVDLRVGQNLHVLCGSICVSHWFFSIETHRVFWGIGPWQASHHFERIVLQLYVYIYTQIYVKIHSTRTQYIKTLHTHDVLIYIYSYMMINFNKHFLKTFGTVRWSPPCWLFVEPESQEIVAGEAMVVAPILPTASRERMLSMNMYVHRHT